MRGTPSETEVRDAESNVAQQSGRRVASHRHHRVVRLHVGRSVSREAMQSEKVALAQSRVGRPVDASLRAQRVAADARLVCAA